MNLNKFSDFELSNMYDEIENRLENLREIGEDREDEWFDLREQQEEIVQFGQISSTHPDDIPGI